jgi:hypothetical protein
MSTVENGVRGMRIEDALSFSYYCIFSHGQGEMSAID